MLKFIMFVLVLVITAQVMYASAAYYYEDTSYEDFIHRVTDSTSAVQILPLPQNITNATIIESPAINSNVSASIESLNIMVNNNAVTSLPNIVIISQSGEIPQIDAMVVTSGISAITNATIPRGSTIIDALSIPTYTIPRIANVTMAIPPIIISGNNTNILMTPPVDSWVPNQQVVISSGNNTTQDLHVSSMNFTASNNITNSNSDEWLGTRCKRGHTRWITCYL